MDTMWIQGGKALNGRVRTSGAKNSALPILFASLLTEQRCEFLEVPKLQDIRTTCKLLQMLGVEVDADLNRNRVALTAKSLSSQEAPYDLVRTMRASVVALGPLVARFGNAKVSLPGGCAIGARPIGFHLTGLEKLGAEVQIESGYVHAKAKRLKGARVTLDFPSVGATENLMMAATLAKGETQLENCAKEPEIVDLADALRAMGATIEGDGTETIRIQGKESLQGCRHSVMGDRIETGTFLAAAFATRGDVTVEGLSPQHLEAVLVKFEEAGASIERMPNAIRLSARNRPQAIDITTLPYPGFPTDMQAQYMAVMILAEGACRISETIFENRFMHVPELVRLGADISVKGNMAVVKGVDRLAGAPLMATDLRASASLIIGALAAEGESVVNRIYHLDRGYEKHGEKIELIGSQSRKEERGMTDSSCIFCKIVSGSIPCQKVLETDGYLCFRDIQPQAKVHLVVIPKVHFATLDEAAESEGAQDLLGGMLVFAAQAAKSAGLVPGGFRTIFNTRSDGGQTVYHLHLHVLGGEKLRGSFA